MADGTTFNILLEKGKSFYDSRTNRSIIRFCVIRTTTTTVDSVETSTVEFADGLYAGRVTFSPVGDSSTEVGNQNGVRHLSGTHFYEAVLNSTSYYSSLSMAVEKVSTNSDESYPSSVSKEVEFTDDLMDYAFSSSLDGSGSPCDSFCGNDVSVMSEKSDGSEVGGLFAFANVSSDGGTTTAGISHHIAYGYGVSSGEDESLDGIWTRELFTNGSTPVSLGFECEVHNHVCDCYIVDVQRVQASTPDGSDAWKFRLFEGRTVEERIVTMDDGGGADVVFGYDSTNDFWSEVGGDGVVSDFFPIQFDANTSKYRLYADSGSLPSSVVRNDFTIVGQPSRLFKGRLLSVVDNVASMYSSVDFKYGSTSGASSSDMLSIMEFRISGQDGADVPNMSCVEFCLCEKPSNRLSSIMARSGVVRIESDASPSRGMRLVVPFEGNAGSNMHAFLNVDSPFINGTYRIVVIPAVYEASPDVYGLGSMYGYPFSKDIKVSYFPRPLTVSFLKDVTYTNSINGRLAQIPFELHYHPSDEASAGMKVEEPVLIGRLTGAYTSNGLYDSGIGEGGGSNPAYPCYWTFDEPLVLKEDTSSLANGSIWNDVCVEYVSETKSYVMHVPFGKSKAPAGKYVEVDTSVKDANGASLGGNYEDVSSGDGVFKTYRMTTENNVTYYLLPAVLSYQNSIRVGNATEGSSSNVVWVICNGSSTVSSDGSNVRLISSTVMDKPYTGWTDDQLDPTKSLGNGYVTGLSSISHMDWVEPGGSEFSFSNIVRQDSSFTMKDGSDQHGMSNSIWFRLDDVFGNTSNPATTTVTIHQELPASLSLTITGSSGSTDYTGFYKRNGRFFPSEYVTVNFSAISEIGMSYDLTGHIKSSVHGDHLESGVAYRHLLKLNAKDIKSPLLGNTTDVEATVRLTVTDEAGNTKYVESSIMCIYSLHRAPYLNLREPGSNYSHGVYYSGNNEAMLEKQTSSTKFTRSWNEIWYPESHGAPLNADGSINESEALRISKSSVDTQGASGPTDSELIKYDRLSLNSGETDFSRDTDGRILQNTDKWSLTKKYPAKENSRLVDDKYQTYWIIDNSGNPDFQLEFEVFDFSSHITKYPENLCARYTGDSVSVFDASDPGCVYDNPVVDENGRRHWKLKDSTRLSHLFSLKGSCFNKTVNPFVMLDSEVDGELVDAGNGFTCPSITNCSRICIVPFTDYGTSDESRGSGFKLKAGPRHNEEYVNYEYINSTGEFWIHLSPQNANASWSSKNGIKVNCDHYASSSVMDYEEGTATFSSRPLYPLLGTFSHYLYLYSPSDKSVSQTPSTYPYKYFSKQSESETYCIKTFAASQDDFVDYANESFYVSYTGSDPVKVGIYDPTVSGNDSSGKLTSYMMNNDTGILTCTGATPPLGRLFADYYHHTFYRLTSDGYGDLYFNGTGILVPASTSNDYTDWAYVDLKIVNEGGNTLNNGLLTFLSRGYVTKGTVVDTVLDMNRPWDVQEGTVAETVNRTGAVKADNYATLVSSAPANRATAYSARSSQTCSLGDIEPKGVVYVRVFWCIAQDATGTSWIDCSKGAKTYSAELSGVYYIFSN